MPLVIIQRVSWQTAQSSNPTVNNHSFYAVTSTDVQQQLRRNTNYKETFPNHYAIPQDGSATCTYVSLYLSEYTVDSSTFLTAYAEWLEG